MLRFRNGEYKWCVLAVTAITFLALMPQLHFWLVRGSQWQGAYATLQGDEFLYSAYVNALIDGRPRRNDPFAGRDSTATLPLPESTFSIQVIPAHVVSWLARSFGASASTAFIALVMVSALLAGLSIYWLLALITGERSLAAGGVLFVLCLGALAGAQGLIGVLLKPGVILMGLPFLRRYQPASAFPLFFIFCALMWRTLKPEARRRAWLFAAMAGITLVVLVFSYLYLWTAAAAWLVCLAFFWLSLRPKPERLRTLGLFTMTAAIAIVALIPYANLLSQRAASLDSAQTMVMTHRPDLFRFPEIIGALVLFALLMAVRRGRIKRSESRLIFAASFALLPLVLFNQQVITGRSMQPYHFESFVANYAALIGLVIMTSLFYQPIKPRRLLQIAALCFLWGAVEVSLPVLAYYRSNIAADQMVPVFLRLRELSKQDGTLSSLREHGQAATLVFSPQREVMGLLPTWTPHGTLLGMGGLDFGSASQSERKESLYLWLYYCALDADHLREILNGRVDDSFMGHYARIAIFGHERVVPMLSSHFEPIRQDEIEQEVRAYQVYVDYFSRENVLLHPLAYLITKVEHEPDLSYVDLWYERDAAERIGDYHLFRLRLRK